MPEPDSPKAAGWWESWSVAAVAVLICVVAIGIVLAVVLAGGLGDR